MNKSIALATLTAAVTLITAGCTSTQTHSAATDKVAPADASRTPASATQHLSGTAASDFIDKHFPNANIPGPVEGKFAFVTGRKTGHADCFVPAMGEASEGVEASCDITEGATHQKLSGPAAEEFVEKHFPNAEIPGPAKGTFTYAPGAKKHGYAKCFYPAMGEVSDGIQVTCDVKYN